MGGPTLANVCHLLSSCVARLPVAPTVDQVQCRSFVNCDVVGFVAFDQILRLVFGSMVLILGRASRQVNAPQVASLAEGNGKAVQVCIQTNVIKNSARRATRLEALGLRHDRDSPVHE